MDSKSELFARICTIAHLTDQDQYRQLWECIDQYIIKDKMTAKTLGEGINLYLTAKRAEGLSARTIDNYAKSLSLLSNYLGDVLIAEIDTGMIREFLAYLKDVRNQKKSSIQTNLCSVRTFFGWLYNERFITENPTNRIKSIHIDKKNARHPMQQENVERARNACLTKRDRAIFEFFLSTGCRLQEVVNIKTAEIDFQNRSVVVTGKGDKSRTVYFSVRAKFFIEEYLNSESKNKEYLFTSTSAPYGKLSGPGIESVLKKIGKRANLNERLFPHKLRHTFASNALTSGMDITSIQQLLGHSNLDTTQIYAEINHTVVHHQYDRLVG